MNLIGLIKKYIDDIYSAYLTTSYEVHNFYDLSLSLVAWKALSDHSKDSDLITGLVPVGPDYPFDDVMKHWDNKKSKEDFGKSMLVWEARNESLLRGQLYIDNHLVRDMREDIWARICQQWMELFDLLLVDGVSHQDTVSLIIDYLEQRYSDEYSVHGPLVTPRKVVNFMANLLDYDDCESIFDPNCRSGNLLHEAAQHMKAANNKMPKIEGFEPNYLLRKFSTIRFALTYDPKKIRIEGFRFPGTNLKETKFDIVITNPPFGSASRSYSLPAISADWSDIARKSNRMEVTFICHMLDRLSAQGRAAVIVPSIYLSGIGAKKELRATLIKRNLLDAVITLPQGIFQNTGVLTAILIFKMNRSSEKVVIFDAAKLGVKSGKRVSLDANKVEEFIKHYSQATIQSGKNILVLSNSEIMEHDFDLSFSAYSDDNHKENRLRPSIDILAECSEIEEELDEVRKKIKKLTKIDPSKLLLND